MEKNIIEKRGNIYKPDLPDHDYEVRSLDTICVNASQVKSKWYFDISYLIVGIIFGIAFTKGEVISWFRIQEMFRLQSFHMYGVIGTAVTVAMISVFIIKKYKMKTISGEPIVFQDKKFSKGQIYGGLLFGFGWALTGACPGPLFAQIGAGFLVVSVVLLSAIAGTWFYGFIREKLPH
jgi:uncharacterized protein